MSSKKNDDPNQKQLGKAIANVGALRAALVDLPDYTPIKFTGAYGSEEEECDVWLVIEPVPAHTCPSCKARHDEQTKRTLVIETGLCSG